MSTDTTLASSGLQQPLRGTVATLGIIALATLFISLFTESTFGSWVSFLMMCCVPALIVCGLVWGGNYPKVVAGLSPATKGLLLTLISLAAGLMIAAVILVLVAGKATPPTAQYFHHHLYCRHVLGSGRISMRTPGKPVQTPPGPGHRNSYPVLCTGIPRIFFCYEFWISVPGALLSGSHGWTRPVHGL